MNILIHKSLCAYENIAVELISASGIALLFVILIDIAKLSFSEVVLTYISTGNIRDQRIPSIIRFILCEKKKSCFLYCYGLYGLVHPPLPPNSHAEILNPKMMVLGQWGLWEVPGS